MNRQESYLNDINLRAKNLSIVDRSYPSDMRQLIQGVNMTKTTVIRNGRINSREREGALRVKEGKKAVVEIGRKQMTIMMPGELNDISQLFPSEIRWVITSPVALSAFDINGEIPVTKQVYAILTAMPGDRLYGRLCKVMGLYGIDPVTFTKRGNK